MTRLDKFREVILDFANVTGIDQAFADEVFRVFPKDNPDVNIVPINCSPEVQRMLDKPADATSQTAKTDC